MARLSERAKGIAYPRLTADQINLMIENLYESREAGMSASDDALAGDVLGYLVAFYTRRWGLPPALRRTLEAQRRDS